MSKNEKTLCVLPWIHLATHPIGTVTPCCLTDMTDNISTALDDVGNQMFLSKDRLENITNSNRFNQIRKQMLDGIEPNVCLNCFLYERGGVFSKRTKSNARFEKYIDECFKNTNSDGSLKNIDYKYIELRLGTVCNLKCVTCNPFSSNRWNQDLHIFKGTEFEKDYFKNEIKTEWYRDYQFYDELFEKSQNVEEIWINGGEPTLIKEHGYFLSKFIQMGKSKNIDLHYSLNCTDFPDHFIEIWKNFRKVRIHLSIDDIGERNTYIRFPVKWETVMQSFNKILKYKDVFNLEVCQTISLLNVSNIDNFKKFTSEHDLIVAHNYVQHPKHLHISLLPDKMKESIMNNIKFMADDEVERLKIELYKPKESDFSKFINFTQLLDKARNIYIGDYLPEWDEYF